MEETDQQYSARMNALGNAVSGSYSREQQRKIIDRFLRDGFGEEEGTAIAVYWQRKRVECAEFESVDEAVRFLDGGQEYETLAPEAIRAGDRIIRGDELDRLMRDASPWNERATGLLLHENSE